MSTNQAPEVTYVAQVLQTTFLNLPAYMQVWVISYVGHIMETFNHIIHWGRAKSSSFSIMGCEKATFQERGQVGE